MTIKAKYDCWDCGGSGIKEVYRRRNIDGGRCYTCQGSGKTNFPTAAAASCKRGHNLKSEGVRDNPDTGAFEIFQRCTRCGHIEAQLHPNNPDRTGQVWIKGEGIEGGRWVKGAKV